MTTGADPTFGHPRTVAIAALLVVLLCFAINGPAPPFSPDSWGYYELARSFSGDAYAISTWRSYASPLPYSSAFPPLWPLLIAGADRSLGLGVYSGYVLNAAIFIAFAACAEAAVRQAFDRRWLGLASALLLFAFPPFQTELLAARAIPLQLLLLAIALWTMTHAGMRPIVRAAALGALAGLLIMTRFDSLFLAGGMVVAAAFIVRDWRAMAVAAGALLLPLAPWVVYSMSTFGQPFATDNAQVALSVDPHEFVTNFHLQPPLSLAEAPARWAWKLVLHLPALAAAVVLVALNALPVSVLAASAARRADRSALLRKLRDPGWWRASHGRLTMLWLSSLLPIGAFVVTGYFNERYFAAPVWLGGLIVLLAIASRPRPGDRRLLAACAMLAFVLGLKVTFAPMVREGWSWASRPAFGFDGGLMDAREFQPLLACLDRTRPAHAVLFADPTTAARFGALSGHRAAMQPRNWDGLSRDEVAEFLRRFDIGYAVPDPRLVLPDGFTEANAGTCAAVVLKLRRPG